MNRADSIDWTSTPTVRAFLAELKAEVIARGLDPARPIAWRHTCSSSGICALDLPRRLGGSGFTPTQMAPVFAAFGSVDLNLRDVPGVGHARLMLLGPNRGFDSMLRDSGLSGGFTAVAITEDGAGSDLHAITTTARPDGGFYVLEGEKRFNARLDDAPHAVVFARVLRPHQEQGLSAFLVATDAAGVERYELQATGLRGVSFGGLRLHNVRVPRDARIGGEGEGLSLFSRHFGHWRLYMAAAAVGAGRAVLEYTAAWLKTRHAFGAPIGRFTHLQQEFARHAARVHMAWLLIQYATRRATTGASVFADAAMAKAEAIEAALDATHWAALVAGARGYVQGDMVERTYRDLLGLRVADGPTDLLRTQVARALLGEELYEMAMGRKSAARVLQGPTRSLW